MADVITPRRPSGRERRRRDAPRPRQRPRAERSGNAGGLAALLKREKVTSGLGVIIRNVRCLCFEPDRQRAEGLHARLRSAEHGELGLLVEGVFCSLLGNCTPKRAVV